MEGKIAKLSVFPESGDVGYGDESDVVAIIQIMLNNFMKEARTCLKKK